MAAKKLDKETKELAIEILEARGKSYEEWLNEEHQKIITSNLPLLRNGLKNLKLK